MQTAVLCCAVIASKLQTVNRKILKQGIKSCKEASCTGHVICVLRLFNNNNAILLITTVMMVRVCQSSLKVTWPKLTTPEQSHTLYGAMQQQLKSVKKSFQEGCAVLPLMQAQVIHAACDNPGAVVLPHLILPMLREQLEAEADAALNVCNSPLRSCLATSEVKFSHDCM